MVASVQLRSCCQQTGLLLRLVDLGVLMGWLQVVACGCMQAGERPPCIRCKLRCWRSTCRTAGSSSWQLCLEATIQLCICSCPRTSPLLWVLNTSILPDWLHASRRARRGVVNVMCMLQCWHHAMMAHDAQLAASAGDCAVDMFGCRHVGHGRSVEASENISMILAA